ncbi:hypothetical protein ACEN88_07875, partial [Massilia sp. CT11-108]
MLNTETPAPQHASLDQYPTAELVNVLVDDQFTAVEAVRAAAPRIAAPWSTSSSAPSTATNIASVPPASSA